MKDFIKSVLATMVGIFGFFIVMGVLTMMSIIGMVASSSAAQNVEENSVFVLNLSGTISDQGTDNPLSLFTGDDSQSTGLNNILSAIKKAKTNDDIKGIYIEAGALITNYATLQEIRNALADFRKSGKWIVAYGDYYTQGAYYVASVANKVYINPKGIVDWHGIGAQTMFYKDFMAKFGVKCEVVKVGTFKSATEIFTEEKMSDANRLQTQTFINGTWQNICTAVSKSRGINIDSLNSYADSYLALQSTEMHEGEDGGRHDVQRQGKGCREEDDEAREGRRHCAAHSQRHAQREGREGGGRQDCHLLCIGRHRAGP